jgi:hypothetical protein
MGKKKPPKNNYQLDPLNTGRKPSVINHSVIIEKIYQYKCKECGESASIRALYKGKYYFLCFPCLDKLFTDRGIPVREKRSGDAELRLRNGIPNRDDKILFKTGSVVIPEIIRGFNNKPRTSERKPRLDREFQRAVNLLFLGDIIDDPQYEKEDIKLDKYLFTIVWINPEKTEGVMFREKIPLYFCDKNRKITRLF